ncbi:hypothetical protein HPB47_017722 [Ixodes persulcatus]|uniref:Uncharacterized protein n=1 Tax=Ixodes persulcatus TaxID=34615 RepID=A0AC60R310_IXOPE|nr:hypothetical protein HPB47_017722 [Ixodes persulcatus]
MEERLIQSRVGFSLTHLEDGEEVNWVLPGLTFAGDIVGGKVRSRVREREVFQWFEATQGKPTLLVYSKNKQLIAAETLLYDNSLGSRLLFEARAGALRSLVCRERFDPNVVSTICRPCREEAASSHGMGVGRHLVELEGEIGQLEAWQFDDRAI